MGFTEKNLQDLVNLAISNEASDIHIRENERPCFRIRGVLTSIKSPELTHDNIMDICNLIIANEQTQTKDEIKKIIENISEKDGSYDVPDLCRLRYNILKFQKKIAIIFRIIRLNVPTIEELGLPDAVKTIALSSRGLVLVTGTTGSGKSSTLAAMINHINNNKRVHIITIEDPVEFVYPQIKSRITQREIGTDTKNFHLALRSALRQDPNVISIGEMRDTETISIALKAAETGHLVLSTIHTTDAITTISRLISMFPSEEQENVRKRLADGLYSTISQRLVKRADGKGMCPAIEIMINTPGIKDCILGKEDLMKMYTYITKGEGHTGSISFDQYLKKLLHKKIITDKVAAEAASASDFLKSLEFE
ncbi:MAG: PilT/PilU family type 4a pilus ATPase [Oligoflexia bacterium]|nr:PilT/PilU family type 4a pilus ATPase [Oligoflexia bacterium]